MQVFQIGTWLKNKKDRIILQICWAKNFFQICEQPVGAQADVFIASLGEKNRHVLKKFLENSPRQENQYFMWIKDHKADKVAVRQ